MSIFAAMFAVPDNDIDLLIALKKGDEKAFRVIYERYWRDIYTMIYRRLHDEDAAKDLVQNIFVNLWVTREKVVAEESLVPYLKWAARNRTINYYKKNMVDLAREDSYGRSQDETYSPELALEAKELERAINEEVASMPENMRKSFQLSRHGDRSIREIAEELSLSEQTIKNNISQALERLRKRTKLFYSEPANLAGLLLILLTEL